MAEAQCFAHNFYHKCRNILKFWVALLHSITNNFYKKISALKTRLRLDKVTASDLAEEVYSGIKKAKKVHDEIEKYYIAAMDHAALDKVCDSISREIHERTIK